MKKGSSSNSFPKTFLMVFHGTVFSSLHKKIIATAIVAVNLIPSREKQRIKSLEKGLGKNLSSERFVPVGFVRLPYEYHRYSNWHYYDAN